MMPIEKPAMHAPTTAEPPPASPAEQIYARYSGLLRYLARKRFRIPDAEVEALVQDAFVAYLTDPAGVRDVRAYLVGTICNRCRKYWNRQEREQSIFSHAELAEMQADDGVLDALLDRLALDSALAQLQPRCREVLTRYYRDHEPVEAIAAAFETKAAYIHKLLHGCRKRAFEAFRGLAGKRTA